MLWFLVPVPRRERHGISIGDARFGIRTEHREKLPPAVGVILATAGLAALPMGSAQLIPLRSNLEALLVRFRFP